MSLTLVIGKEEPKLFKPIRREKDLFETFLNSIIEIENITWNSCNQANEFLKLQRIDVYPGQKKQEFNKKRLKTTCSNFRNNKRWGKGIEN